MILKVSGMKAMQLNTFVTLLPNKGKKGGGRVLRMALKAHELYQGEDWLTYRPTVAQVFDTLDRLREFCEDTSFESLRGPIEVSWSAFARGEETISLMMGSLLGMCDDLDGEIAAVLAELSAHLRLEAAHRWMGFEMQMQVKAIRAFAEGTPPEPHAVPSMLDEIGALVERMSFILKTIDQ